MTHKTHARLVAVSALVVHASACGSQADDVSAASAANAEQAIAECQQQLVSLQAQLNSTETNLAEAKGQTADLQRTNAALVKELESLKTSLADARRVTPAPQTPTPVENEPSKKVEPGPAPSVTTSYDAKMFASPRLKFDVPYLGEKLSVAVSNLNWKASRWIMDRYGSEWHYLQPTKGSQFVTFDFSITTNSKDPRLPAFYVAQMKDGFPAYFSVMQVEFYKWTDYGSYLGNYTDYGNDFSRSTTVRFTAGREIPVSLAKEALFVVATNTPCMKRQYDRFGNPPTSYSTFDCPMSALRKGPDQFWAEHTLVAVLNPKQLFPK